jgi:hypothetical protein
MSVFCDHGLGPKLTFLNENLREEPSAGRAGVAKRRTRRRCCRVATLFLQRQKASAMVWTGRRLVSVLLIMADTSIPVCGPLVFAQTVPTTAIAAKVVTRAYMRP